MIKLIEKINDQIKFTEASGVTFEKEYDIVIAGLGTAGAISALTAKKLNKSVLAVERFNAAGGTVTVGGVGVYYFGGRGGIYEEVDALQKASAVNLAESKYPHSDIKKYILDELLSDENICIMYESVITGIYADGRKIIGVRVFSHGTERNFSLKSVIDATGDGDICDMAGCCTTFGSGEENSAMPYTVVKSFMLDGIMSKTNHDCSKVDHRDIEAFSHSLIKAYSDFCGDEEQKLLLKLQPLPGIREGRLLVGEERIVFDDILAGKLSAEPIMYAYADFDKHGFDIAFDSELFIKWHVLANLGALNVTVPIPKGALIAREYDNLLVSGRCLSVDHEVATHTRMMRDMQKLGEASAVMASIATDDGVALKDISYPKLRARLEKTGCLSEENNKGFRYDHRIPAPEYIKDAVWLTDEVQINKELSTLVPGLAIWSAKLMGDNAAEFLIKNLHSENDNLRKHSAIALAVMNRPEGAGVLREIVSDRDRTELSDMRKNNKRHLSQALCALGILKDIESKNVIIALVSDRNEHIVCSIEKGFNTNYYITLSSAVAALLALAEAYPRYKDEIISFLKKQLSDMKYVREITDKNENSSEYIQAAEIYGKVRSFETKL